MNRTVGLYVASSYGLAALMGAGFALSGASYDGITGVVFGALYMLTPLAAVVLTQALTRERPLRGLAARPRLNGWFAVASLGALGLVMAAMLVGFLLPGHRYDPSVDALLERFAAALPPEQLDAARQQLEALPIHPALLAIPQALIAGATVNALFAFGEEIGWRGLLHRELRSLGFWKMSAVVGVLWGFWHAPIILLGHNYPEHSVAGVFLFVVICVLLSPLHTFARERTGTVWGAAVCHGTFNAAAGIPVLVTSGGNDLTLGVTGLAGVIGLALCNLILWAATRPVLTMTDQAGRQ